MDRRRFIVRSAGALATVGLGGVVAKHLESRHGEQASVNPSAGEREMATREEMFVRYSDSVETLQAGEAETVDQIAATLLNIAKKVGERQRHTVRGVHAKSHGLLKAEVRVLPDLRLRRINKLFRLAWWSGTDSLRLHHIQTFCREGLGQAYEPQHPVPSWVLTTVRTLYLAKFAMPARNSASFPMLSALGSEHFCKSRTRSSSLG
jgi:hypothetical protein